MSVFQYNSKESLKLNKPHIVGYMSVDEVRHYHLDVSQLKFLNKIPQGQLHFDLNHNINLAVKRTTDDNNDKIQLLLKFLLDYDPSRYLRINATDAEPTFVTYRRTLISIMCNAFGRGEHLYIRGCLFNNCIYLCSMESPQEIQRRQTRSAQEQKFCAWGYKFEQYLLSDSPNMEPDINRPVIENEEFSLYYMSQLGKHKLFYGAQIDALLATNGKVTDPLKSNAFEGNLDYLRNNSFAELKTNREIQTNRQSQNFKRHKLLRCWCQCYLANLKGLLVGFRNDDGIVQRVQWLNTEDIEEYCKSEWKPQMALQYLDHSLSFIKKVFCDAIQNVSQSECPISFDFNFNTERCIHVTPRSIHDDPILPDWYLTVK